MASLLLLLVTSMTGLIFFRLYQAKPPFSKGNIRIIRFVAILLILLSVLPMLFQLGFAGFFNIDINKISINYMYIFIGMIFYCISYIFEHGDIVQRQVAQTVDVQENMILTMAEAAEAKSGNVGQHIKRVSEYSKVIARHMGMTDEEAETMRLASMLHDIGNILIPSEILEKESSLNDEEFAIMKTARTVQAVEMDALSPADLLCAERINIPLGLCRVCCCRCSSRCYRRTWRFGALCFLFPFGSGRNKGHCVDRKRNRQPERAHACQQKQLFPLQYSHSLLY